MHREAHPLGQLERSEPRPLGLAPRVVRIGEVRGSGVPGCGERQFRPEPVEGRVPPRLPRLVGHRQGDVEDALGHVAVARRPRRLGHPAEHVGAPTAVAGLSRHHAGLDDGGQRLVVALGNHPLGRLPHTADTGPEDEALLLG